jgi:GNAT superfamily N-acetyltransferase
VEHGGRVAWLEELYVVPARRNAGIGQLLLDEVLQTAKGLGCLAVDLEVDVEHARAEHLYERAGFRRLRRMRWTLGLET